MGAARRTQQPAPRTGVHSLARPGPWAPQPRHTAPLHLHVTSLAAGVAPPALRLGLRARARCFHGAAGPAGPGTVCLSKAVRPVRTLRTYAPDCAPTASKQANRVTLEAGAGGDGGGRSATLVCCPSLGRQFVSGGVFFIFSHEKLKSLERRKGAAYLTSRSSLWVPGGGQAPAGPHSPPPVPPCGEWAASGDAQ